jgi:hypothetical protein
MCWQMALRAMHHSCLSALHKSKAHIKSNSSGDSPKYPFLVESPTFTSLNSIFPTVPVHSVPNSGASAVERINSFELKKYFGSRSLSDWTTLEHTGSGIHVIQDKDAPTTLGDITTITGNNHGKLLQRPSHALHTVGMDIGYGEGTSSGGYKYALTLVDYATRYT